MPVESQYVRPHIRWGQATKLVCWLVVPSVFDLEMPDGYTLQYVLSHPGNWSSSGGCYPVPFLKTIDREHAKLVSELKYEAREAHNLSTEWLDEHGKVVNKIMTKRVAKELRSLSAYPSEST